MKALPVWCPQEYRGCGEMTATLCTRCSTGWDAETKRCTVDTGCEHLPLVPAVDVPTCPIQNRCRHQVQNLPDPCAVRARGLICESALIEGGLSRADAASHPLSFNADFTE